MSIPIAVADELLSTTRAVRKRLDFSRPVPRDIVLDCIRISQQAPTGGNMQKWRWLVVTDAAKRAALARIYREVTQGYFVMASEKAKADGEAQTARVYNSADYLADHLQDAPVHVIPCQIGKPGEVLPMQSAFFGSIYPAIWSFNLALRARGLGTALTTMHLVREAEAAEILGIPEDVTQIALLPVAYTLGDSFKLADRPPASEVTFFDSWGQTG